MLLMVAVGSLLTACQKEDTTARAILASVNVLEYVGESAAPQTILITSDGDWSVEAPDWVKVTNADGNQVQNGTSGQTEVTIEVTDNFRDGALDNPRRGTVLFKGLNLWANCEVKIRQDGDKFRDPKDYTVDEYEAAEPETVVRIPGMIVSVLTSDGFIATIADGSKNVYVKKPAQAVKVGDKVSVQGEKWYTDEKMSYLNGDRIQAEGTAEVPAQTPVDATTTLDALKGTTPILISVEGVYNGSAVLVAGMANAIYFEKPDAALNVKQYTGHKVKVTGYYYGTAAPVVKLVPVKIEDRGLDEIIYLNEDFEWLGPWGINPEGKGDAGDQFGKFNSSEYCPQLQNCIVDGVSAFDAIVAKGYDFVFSGSDVLAKGAASSNAKNCTYLQNGYIKLGKTAYYAGLVLPSIKPQDGEDLLLTFDWGPMMSGSNNWDDTRLVVVVANGESEKKFEIPAAKLTHGSPGDWQHASVDLTGVTVKADTKITIRNIDAHWPLDDKFGKTGLVRYFLDNIKIKVIK